MLVKGEKLFLNLFLPDHLIILSLTLDKEDPCGPIADHRQKCPEARFCYNSLSPYKQKLSFKLMLLVI